MISRQTSRIKSARVGGLKQRQPVVEEFTLESSPFKRVDDAEVFVLREKTKTQTATNRLDSRKKKIWEKTTATTNFPLPKIRDEDIPPKKEDSEWL
jgi:hypothetical protein